MKFPQSRETSMGETPTLTFGTRPDKALGDPAVWAETEAMIRAGEWPA
jgi:hypothetical protein